VDDWIVGYAQANNAIVCTNDAKLRKRLREADIKVITMKSKSKLGYV
jgi:rRNA-processing protein FCF1